MYRTEVVGAHGDVSLEAIDVRDAATAETTRLQSGGLYLFIGADAETAWLPPETALDRHGYVLTGSEVTAAGRWELERDPHLLETSARGSSRAATSDLARSNALLPPWEGSMAIAFVHQYIKETFRVVACRPAPEPETV